jgi:hypothetical protein
VGRAPVLVVGGSEGGASQTFGEVEFGPFDPHFLGGSRR